MNTVSIVIIGRNEERGIAECIRAARGAAEQIGGAEIIYVDSASTDNTVAAVRAEGVRVVSLKPEWELSPSAGRFIGTRAASGDYILFLDADTLIYPNFLAAAIEQFEGNPQIAGVNGWLDDTDEKGILLKNVEIQNDKISDVKWLRGPCCFYRREALLEVGSFNPFIKVEEEAELGLRLKKKGWLLKIIPVRMACHTRCYHLQTTKNVIFAFKRQIISKRMGEVTNTIAHAFRHGNGLTFCWLRLKTTIIFLSWMIALTGALFLPSYTYPKTIFTVLFALGLILIVGKKRSIARSCAFILNKTIVLIDLLSGIRRIKIKSSDLYPLDVIERN